MKNYESVISYLSGSKDEITEKTLNLSLDFAKNNEINDILLASTTGYSAKKALAIVENNINLTVVTHANGYIEKGKNEFDPETKEKLLNNDHNVFTASHLFKGLNGFFQKKYGGTYPTLIFADAFRMISPGVKVIFEISLMTADAGIIPTDKWIIACGGSHRGLDTAVVIKPTNTSKLDEFKFGPILCLPKIYR